MANKIHLGGIWFKTTINVLDFQLHCNYKYLDLKFSRVKSGDWLNVRPIFLYRPHFYIVTMALGPLFLSKWP